MTRPRRDSLLTPDRTARIRAYAFAEGRNVLEVARDIVARKITLEDDA